MSWNAVILVASLAAVVVFAMWAVRLHAAGDPVWRVAVATALLALASALLRLGGPRLIWVVLAFFATVIGAGFLISFSRGRVRGAG